MDFNIELQEGLINAKKEINALKHTYSKDLKVKHADMDMFTIDMLSLSDEEEKEFYKREIRACGIYQEQSRAVIDRYSSMLNVSKSVIVEYLES